MESQGISWPRERAEVSRGNKKSPPQREKHGRVWVLSSSQRIILFNKLRREEALKMAIH